MDDTTIQLWTMIGTVSAALFAAIAGGATWASQRIMKKTFEREELANLPFLEITNTKIYYDMSTAPLITDIRPLVINANMKKIKQARYSLFLLDHNAKVIDHNFFCHVAGSEFDSPFVFNNPVQLNRFFLAIYFAATDKYGRYANDIQIYHVSTSLSSTSITNLDEQVPEVETSYKQRDKIISATKLWFKQNPKDPSCNPFQKAKRFIQYLICLSPMALGFAIEHILNDKAHSMIYVIISGIITFAILGYIAVKDSNIPKHF